MTSKPTPEFYDYLQSAYQFFNEKLYQGGLPDCLITVQRQKRVMAYVDKERWVNEQGVRTYELALNPGYFANHPLIEVFQTLVHEQCHIWQDVFGRQQSRRCYHNREWADKMLSIGLHPSDTGKPGGKQVGQSMADYPIPGGLFERVATTFVKLNRRLPWTDRYPAVNTSAQPRITELVSSEDDDIDLYQRVSDSMPSVVDEAEIIEQSKPNQKITYQCPDCQIKVWGKPGLRIACEGCDQSLVLLD